MAALNAVQAAALDAAGHVVHGVDAQGGYLGLVPSDQAASTADGPAPVVGTWQWQSGAWVRVLSLAEHKADAWTRIKDGRARALAGTFTAGGLIYDIDPTNITGATVAAMRALQAAAPFAQTWVLANNTTTTLNAAGMVAVGEACAAAVNAIWQISIGLRADIEAATTTQQLAAISWPPP